MGLRAEGELQSQGHSHSHFLIRFLQGDVRISTLTPDGQIFLGDVVCLIYLQA